MAEEEADIIEIFEEDESEEQEQKDFEQYEKSTDNNADQGSNEVERRTVTFTPATTFGLGKTSTYLSSYEVSRIVAFRASTMNPSDRRLEPRVEYSDSEENIDIAIRELLGWKIPVVLTRTLPSGDVQVIPLRKELWKGYQLKLPEHFIFYQTST